MASSPSQPQAPRTRLVMAKLVPAIHDWDAETKSWMPGTPAGPDGLRSK